MEFNFALCILVTALLINDATCNFGPYVPPTSGAVWPKPQDQVTLDGYFILNKTEFDFQITKESCLDLIRSLNRYKATINSTSFYEEPVLNDNYDLNVFIADPNYLGHLKTVNVTLHEPCTEDEYPFLGMNENYTLNVTKDEVTLSAVTIWGIYRGLETFSQIIHIGADRMTLIVNCTNIHDYPRLPYRGLLFDTARHFFNLSHITRTLDAMAYTKMNVFHWHITDDESFPYQSAGFPEMSMLGAYHRLLQYTMSDIQFVIEYARRRGIMVIPEFDTPGHTASWGLAKPELLTTCYKDGKRTEDKGPLDPSQPSTYIFMEEFLQEIINTFPAKYIHFGGDDVDYTCWKTNPDIINFMKKRNVTNNFDKLLNIYIEAVIKLVENKKEAIVCEEIFSNNASLSDSTIVHVWKSLTWPETMEQVTSAGHEAVLSSCWVADEVLGAGDWVLFYMCDPVEDAWPEPWQRRARGGEVAAHTGNINGYNLDERLWPKAAAAGERLWSAPQSILNMRDIARRLEEHACRLNRRGVPAKPPNGPGVCL